MDLTMKPPVVPKLKNLGSHKDQGQKFQVERRSFNFSKKTTDFKSDMDEGQIGMIGEFLKQEDTKHLTKESPRPATLNQPSLFF